jgi:hypothetical protein
MLRRTGFKRKVYEPPSAPPARPATRRGVLASCAAMSTPVPKDESIDHEGYRRLVASLPCIRCGIWGLSQCAHANTGKGTGLKTSDLDTFPLCADSPGRRGCHPQFDQNALYSKAARRLIEPTWVADTQRRIQAMGAWPKNLPRPEVQ